MAKTVFCQKFSYKHNDGIACGCEVLNLNGSVKQGLDKQVVYINFKVIEDE